jgi:predicted MFS family arabinose efflux permease
LTLICKSYFVSIDQELEIVMDQEVSRETDGSAARDRAPSVLKPPSDLSQGMILVLAVASGVSVATIYFPQAITPLIAAGLGVTAEAAAGVVTAAQLGYAAGLFLLVPLGDRLPQRSLVPTLLLLTAFALMAASLAPSLPVLVGASALAGFTTVVPQILLPMAAGLVAASRRGEVTGTILAGLLGGILLARTFGGTLGEHFGWREPYLVAAALILLLATVMIRVIPRTIPASSQPYPKLIGAAFVLLRDEVDLRRSGLYQALTFGSFTAAWTSLALFLGGPVYSLGGQSVGLIALVGAASVFITPIAGRWIDRRGPDAISLLCFIGVIVSAAILAFGALGGALGLAALTLGMLVLDVAVQCGQTANQARIFALRPDARSRINTAYMTCAFLGGSVGSWIGVKTFALWGWIGVCGAIALAGAAALTRHLAHGRKP